MPLSRKKRISQVRGPKIQKRWTGELANFLLEVSDSQAEPPKQGPSDPPKKGIPRSKLLLAPGERAEEESGLRAEYRGVIAAEFLHGVSVELKVGDDAIQEHRRLGAVIVLRRLLKRMQRQSRLKRSACQCRFQIDDQLKELEK